MMRLSELQGRRVIATGTAATVGHVTGAVIDAHGRTLAALRVKGAPAGELLPWSEISGLGPDAIMVNDPEAVRQPSGREAELTGKYHDFLGKRLLSDEGEELGQVTDLTFDDDGTVVEIHSSDGSIRGATLVGCGSYAAVVHRRRGVAA
jgi:YD repeat-containing protein